MSKPEISSVPREGPPVVGWLGSAEGVHGGWLPSRLFPAAGITAAGTFLAAAVLATLLPDAARRGTWLPLHLALAGGAGTAIASMMPFFAAALAAAAPVDARLRRAAIGAVALGALLAPLGGGGGAGSWLARTAPGWRSGRRGSRWAPQRSAAPRSSWRTGRG